MRYIFWFFMILFVYYWVNKISIWYIMMSFYYFIIEIAPKRWCCDCSCCNICPSAEHLKDYKILGVFLGNGSYQGIIQRTIMRQIKYFVPLKRCMIWVRCWHNAVMTRINHIMPFIGKYIMNNIMNTSQNTESVFPMRQD